MTNEILSGFPHLSVNYNRKINPIAALGGSSQSNSNSTEDTVIQYTSPWASLAAGQIQANAAKAASFNFTTQADNAINSINSQYNNIATALAPQTQTGIEALDTLNQYLQLDPYRPLTAPVAPTAPTQAALDNQASQYVQANSFTDGSGHFTYGGVGSTAGGGGSALGGGYNSDAYDMVTNDAAFGLMTNAASNPTSTTPIVLNSPLSNYTGAIGISGPYGASTSPTSQTIGSTANGAPNAINVPNGKGLLSNTTAGLASWQGFDDAVTQGLTDLGQNTLQNTYDVNSQTYDQQKGLYDFANQQADLHSTPYTAQQINDKVTNLPGYQAQLSQGMQAINSDAAAKGYTGSGAMLQQLNQFGQNTLAQFYGNTLNQLAGLAASGNSAATQQVAASQNAGNAISQLYTQIGSAQGNSNLAQGNALGNALTAANQNFASIQTGQSSSSSSSNSGADLSGIGSLIGQFL